MLYIDSKPNYIFEFGSEFGALSKIYGVCFFQVELVLLLALSCVIPIYARSYGGVGNVCDQRPKTRDHIMRITEFGAVGDGKTLNTLAFQNAVFSLKSYADKGGAQLYVPSGRWLTGSFNLTSHITLFLDKDAVILASQVCVCVCLSLL